MKIYSYRDERRLTSPSCIPRRSHRNIAGSWISYGCCRFLTALEWRQCVSRLVLSTFYHRVYAFPIEILVHTFSTIDGVEPGVVWTEDAASGDASFASLPETRLFMFLQVNSFDPAPLGVPKAHGVRRVVETQPPRTVICNP